MRVIPLVLADDHPGYQTAVPVGYSVLSIVAVQGGGTEKKDFTWLTMTFEMTLNLVHRRQRFRRSVNRFVGVLRNGLA